MKFLIVSDLHVYDEHDKTSKLLNRNSLITTDSSSSNPLTGLIEHCQENKITADVLLCPGDLGERADIKGIEYAWGCLEKLAKVIKAKRILGVSGNHDYNSRLVDDKYDVREHLIYLEPEYPTTVNTLNKEYWTYGFYTVKDKDYNLIGLNSCHSHGYDDDEKDFGRVSINAINKIKAQLTNLPNKSINILMCHHSPSPMTLPGYGETDYMKNGQELIAALETSSNNRWVVIHGHLHAPLVYNAQGSTARTPIVISSGSLGSPLYASLLEQAGNQFHMLEFDPSHFAKMGLVGSLKSWEWGAAIKWYSPDKPYPKHQHYSGFGNSTQINVLAQTILQGMDESIVRGEKIDELFPMLKFTAPGDLHALKIELETHQIGLQLEKGKVVEIGKGVINE